MAKTKTLKEGVIPLIYDRKSGILTVVLESKERGSGQWQVNRGLNLKKVWEED